MIVMHPSHVEVAVLRWALAAELGLQSWPEREEDANTLVLHLDPLGPPWAEVARQVLSLL